MTHEKIIQRPNGDRVNIQVSIGVGVFDELPHWSVSVTICRKGKRKFVNVYTNDAATKDEILSAKLELWEKIRPTL